MKKMFSTVLSVSLLGGLFSLQVPDHAQAADFTATVNVNTTTEYDLQEHAHYEPSVSFHRFRLCRYGQRS